MMNSKMRFSNMTDNDLWRGMAASNEAMVTLAKSQSELAEGRGLPSDFKAREQLMFSNIRMMAKLRQEHDEYFTELQRRYPEKGPL
jgi:hypothetical protein